NARRGDRKVGPPTERRQRWIDLGPEAHHTALERLPQPLRRRGHDATEHREPRVVALERGEGQTHAAARSRERELVPSLPDAVDRAPWAPLEGPSGPEERELAVVEVEPDEARRGTRA